MNTENNLFLKISENEININNAMLFLENNFHGANSIFIGKIRNNNLGKNVLSVSYDVFNPLAIKSFEEISKIAVNTFENDVKIYIEHFKGKLKIGGISIIIGVSTKHRREAIDICEFIIEEIKHNSPIWKQEEYENGTSEWIKGHALCQHNTRKRESYEKKNELHCK